MKINPMQLFSGKKDIRVFLLPDIHHEKKAQLMSELELTEEQIDAVLKATKLYVQMDALPKTIELEELE